MMEDLQGMSGGHYSVCWDIAIIKWTHMKAKNDKTQMKSLVLQLTISDNFLKKVLGDC